MGEPRPELPGPRPCIERYAQGGAVGITGGRFFSIDFYLGRALTSVRVGVGGVRHSGWPGRIGLWSSSSAASGTSSQASPPRRRGPGHDAGAQAPHVPRPAGGARLDRPPGATRPRPLKPDLIPTPRASPAASTSSRARSSASTCRSSTCVDAARGRRRAAGRAAGAAGGAGGGDRARQRRGAGPARPAASRSCVDCRPAWEALELPERTVLHAGPPLAWARMCEPDAGRRAVRDPLRGLGRQRRRRPTPGRDRSRAAGAVPPLARGGPDDRHRSRARCRCSSSRTARTATAPTSPSTRGSARSCATAPTTRACSRACAGSRREAGPLLGAALRAARRPAAAPADGAGAAHGRRDAPAQRGRLGAASRAASCRTWRASAGATTRVARLAEFIGRQRPVLPEPRDGGRQGDRRRGRRRGRLDGGDDDGAQRHRLRHPRRRARRSLVHGARRPCRSVSTCRASAPTTRTPTWATARSWRRSASAACAMAASPAVARFVGAGGMAEALAVTEEMREISAGEHPHFRIPALDERGTPVGIDVRRVVETGITPLINTGIAGRRAGTWARSAPAWRARRWPASPPRWRRWRSRGHEPRRGVADQLADEVEQRGLGERLRRTSQRGRARTSSTAAAGRQDDRQVLPLRRGAQPGQELTAVHPGHRDVEQDQVGRELAAAGRTPRGRWTARWPRSRRR